MSLVIISGPTASGKSHIADLVYNRYPAKIINADSMQIYADLPILAAQPDDLQDNPNKYALYGCMPYYERCSVAKWVALATAEIEKTIAEKKIPVLVGGTGMYIKALVDGLVVVPEIEAPIREEVGNIFARLGKEEFYAQLLRKDPSVEGKIRPSDSTRMIRAMEVFMQTGKSIHLFKDNVKRLYSGDYNHISLFPERSVLYQWCEQRFDQMIDLGVIEEVKEFLAKRDDKKVKYGIESALGYKEIKEYIEGKIDIETVKEKAKQATRNYAKRQLTWFRNQMPNKKCLHYESASEAEKEFWSIAELTFK